MFSMLNIEISTASVERKKVKKLKFGFSFKTLLLLKNWGFNSICWKKKSLRIKIRL
jgi:hypothetical protein